MKEWFTSMELVSLPGMPTTVQGVRYRAKSERFAARKCSDGKGSEYHINSLPAETRRYLAEQAVAEQGQVVTDHAAGGKAMAKLLVSEVPVKPDAGRKLLTLGEGARKKVDARLLILQAADIFLASYQACQQGEVGRRAFIEAYRTRALSLPASVYDRQKPFSLITLRRWQGTLADEGPAALAGNYQRERPSTVVQSPDLAPFLTALVTAKPHLANKWGALHELATQYSEMNQLGWQIPSQSSLRRWLVKWLADNKVAFTYATNPDAYNNKYRSAIEEMYPWMAQPNDVWEFDSTPVDAMLVDGRHSIIAVIDVFTRRVRLLVAKSSSSEGICLLLRKTLLAWGTLNDNGVMRTDNGSDYVSQRVMSICTLLGMNVSRSNAYSGWEKPHIERFFRTLSHGLIELLPSYIGHCVADRQVIEARKSFAERLEEKRKPDADKELFELAMTAAELQTLSDIYDATEQPLILVGMEEIARRISQRKQLFNRISQWIEFKPADLEDVSLIASEMLEVDVEIDDALLDLIRKRSNGVVRTIVSALDKIEKMAMASDARIIRLEDVDASELLHDVRRSR